MENFNATVEKDSEVVRLNALPEKLRMAAKGQFLTKVGYTDRQFKRRYTEGTFTPEESKILKEVLDNL